MDKLLKIETTGPQTVGYSFGDGILSRLFNAVGTYSQLRTLRKDPTVALARSILVSCIQAGSWNIEADEDVPEEVQLFMEHLLSLREDFLYNAIAFGRVDFGWVGFEKIFKVENSRILIEELKPLLHDMTNILVTPRGRFNGYRQSCVGHGTLSGFNSGPFYPVDLTVDKCLHIAFDVEAGNYYGMPLLENVRSIMDMWNECNEGARRYDKKIAGTHWKVKYPPGTGIIDGVKKGNDEIAAMMLPALQSSGSVFMPTTSAEVLQELNVKAEVADLYSWNVELLSDTGRKQADFVDRLKYLDAQKVRSLLIPERAVLEGQFGTKAEAGIHTNTMITNLEMMDKSIAQMVNKQLINQLLELNFGSQYIGKVRLVALPLINEQIEFLRELYKNILDPDLDVEVLRDKLDVPGVKIENET